MKEERLERIEKYIRDHRSVSLDELCDVFNVSKNTIRRDVAEIVQVTDIKKIYGGVAAPYNKIPPSFSERSTVNLETKVRIGECASKYVNDGDIIYIDSGTTTCQMIDFLANKKDVTIITNSIDVINRAVRYPNLNLIALMGSFNRKTYSFTGQEALESLENYNISKAFMAANGFTLENGATQSTAMEFEIKKKVVSKSDKVLLMIENRKFGAVSLLTYCTPDKVSMVITEKKPDVEFCTRFRKIGGEIILS